MAARIHSVRARRIWDSRGVPTIEVEVTSEGGGTGRASAPSSMVAEPDDAAVLRDGGAAFAGLGVSRAVTIVNTEIARALSGLNVADQAGVDRLLIEIDGTANKQRLGANTTIAVSLAAAQAAAASRDEPLWRSLAGNEQPGSLPMPVVQMIGGGAQTGRLLDIQEVAVIPIGAEDYVTALDWSAEVHRHLGDMLAKDGRSLGSAPMGGWWPAFDTNEQAIESVVRAIERAGFAPGEDIAISIDVAANQLGRRGQYALLREGKRFSADQLIGVLLGWLRKYPVVAVIDPLADDDVAALARFTAAAGAGVETTVHAGTATDPRRIGALANAGAGTSTMIDPAAIGTLTEAKEAIDAARMLGWGLMLTARAGESGDAALAHLAVGWNIERLRAGGVSRGERIAIWNEGLRIASQLTAKAALPPRTRFRW
jgi:enolase